MLAAGRVACAQDQSVARMVYFSAQPGSRTQVEGAIKKQMDWRREQKDSWRWLTWEYASGELPRYCVATFGHAWADFHLRTDALRDSLEQALGKRKAAKVFGQFTSAVKTHQRSAVRLRPDLSLLPGSGGSKP
jgi:hypothetical protein